MTIESIQRTTAIEISATSGSPSTAATTPGTLLPEPSPYAMGGDIGAEITALAVQSGQAENNLDTTAEQSENTIQDQAEQAEVNTMHDEASTMRANAWESGCLQMAAGAVTIGGAIDGMNGGSSSAVAAFKGTSDLLTGASTLAGGLGKAAETDDEALATAFKATADSSQREGDACRQAEKDSSSYISAAIDFYREYQSTKAQANTAAVHGA